MEEPNFHQYLQEEDRLRFDEFLSRQAEVKQAGALPVYLVDSMGGKVPVHIYHTSCIDADDKLWHILGIQEGQGRDYMQPEASPSNLVAVANERTELDQDSLTSPQSECALSFWGQGAEGATTCLIETTLALEVATESEECRSTFGLSLPGGGLLSQVNEPEQLLWWLHQLALQKANASTEVISEKFPEELRILGAGAEGVRYKADVHATVLVAGMDDAGHLAASMFLQFHPKRTKSASARQRVRETLQRVRAKGRRFKTSQAKDDEVPSEHVGQEEGSI